jgi:polyphenol oxidase
VAVTAEVRWPGVLRSRQETDGTDIVKFDAYVNAMEHDKVEPGGREMAESFVCFSSQHGRHGEGDDRMMIETSNSWKTSALMETIV